jgi:hypothetical protein
MRDDDVFLEPAIYSIAEVLEPSKIDLEYMGLVGVIIKKYLLVTFTK